MEIGVSTFEAIMLGVSVVGVYVRLSSDVNKLKSRVHQLESQGGKVEDMLTELMKEIQTIKLLLARKNIDG
jgi:prefoldin subunit 5